MSRPAVGGLAEDGWGVVVDAFRATVPDVHQSGAALSVWSDGREVVDIRLGTADARSGRLWREDTPAVVFSVSKGLAALVVGVLVEDGLVALDQPVAELWPDFAAHGKDAVTVGDALAHRAGVSAPRDDVDRRTLLDLTEWARRIAAQEPLWSPGEAHAYHTLSMGPIVDAIVRRASGRSFAQVFAERVAAPLAADVTFVPDARLLDEVAHITTSDAWDRTASGREEDPWITRAATLGGIMPRALVAGETGFNDPDILAVGLPSAGGIGTASGLARIWSSVIAPTRGVRLFDPVTTAQLVRPRSEGPFAFSAEPPYPRWGAGVNLVSDSFPGLSPASFGHGGAGGQMTLADPDTGIAYVYIRNRMDPAPPADVIVPALRRVTGSHEECR
ncbi:serine hydrolase domain-containing protein [Microbacterium sp. SSW1-59]|uniref:serine hydrolase domain-containing protein n=1 Tax=Microbacterium xanthum TaxID=3079794 RepID=UPI002AD4E755|nr:serine hydrolase domain-containing protein [Microbacterium sp. SSW1-59]MDZ8200366.1 serine hydrolase domain-containing protein [Microbacterium sp. SSW1-59]